MRRFIAPFVLLTLAPAVHAQTATAPDNIEQRARAVIKRAIQQYHTLDSYCDELVGHYEIVAKDAHGKPLNEEQSFHATLRFKRPNHLALTTPELGIHSDGKQLWLHLDPLAQYTQQPAPKPLDLAAIDTQLPVPFPPHLAAYILANPNQSLDDLFPMINELTNATPESHDNQPGVRIDGRFDPADTPLPFANTHIPFSAWFSDKTGLLGYLRVDFTEQARKSAANNPTTPMEVTREQITLRFENVTTNTKIPPTEFTYEPPGNFAEVQTFGTPSHSPLDLLGKPAPPITGTTLDGKPFNLADLRGRVVLLDFWATWCAPCVAALPTIQKTHEKYAKQPVTIVGINQDLPGRDDHVRNYVKNQKLTFTQLRDANSMLGTTYHVTGIPCSFLIDKTGTIQSVHLGYNPQNYARKLHAEIDTLLRGESLVKPNDNKQP